MYRETEMMIHCFEDYTTFVLVYITSRAWVIKANWSECQSQSRVMQVIKPSWMVVRWCQRKKCNFYTCSFTHLQKTGELTKLH